MQRDEGGEHPRGLGLKGGRGAPQYQTSRIKPLEGSKFLWEGAGSVGGHLTRATGDGGREGGEGVRGGPLLGGDGGTAEERSARGMGSRPRFATLSRPQPVRTCPHNWRSQSRAGQTGDRPMGSSSPPFYLKGEGVFCCFFLTRMQEGGTSAPRGPRRRSPRTLDSAGLGLIVNTPNATIMR